jgi:DNA repair exonuclease SbcCD nuclease subunit
MSKILIIGDTHLGLGYPNSVDKWFKVHQEYFNNFLIPLIKREMTKDDLIIHCGDLFDNRSVVPINILNYAQSILEEMSQICPVNILIGNHDLYTKATNDVNTVKLYKYIPNIVVYEEPTKIDFMGKSILMLPWVEKRKDQIEVLKKYSGCDYLFCHSDLNGAKMHLSSVAHKNLDKIDVEDFSGYKNVYSGHIHILQRNKNFTFVGNNFEMDRNDLGNQKGIFILDTIDGTERFIPNNVSPRFKKMYVRSEEDILSLEEVSTKDFYVDLIISSSLLVNNRKLRRKLEGMLESGNFASVDYLDDMSIMRDEKMKELGINEELTQEELEAGVIPTIQLEYTEVIRQYINGQGHDSEKIKSGIVQEFNEVVRIYEENYKSKVE